jgi:hypothetical protein
MSFDPCNHALKIRESIWDSNSQHGISLVSVRVNSLTLFALLGACDVTPGCPSWLATLQALALVASARLGLRHLATFVSCVGLNGFELSRFLYIKFGKDFLKVDKCFYTLLHLSYVQPSFTFLP